MVLMNADGEVVDKQRISNQEITNYLQEKVPQETYAVLEATRNWPFMVDLLHEHVQQVDLVHAKGVRAIANAAVKTDQIDASTLAHLARLNYIPKAYAAPKETRDCLEKGITLNEAQTQVMKLLMSMPGVGKLIAMISWLKSDISGASILLKYCAAGPG
jgi:transposase